MHCSNSALDSKQKPGPTKARKVPNQINLPNNVLKTSREQDLCNAKKLWCQEVKAFSQLQLLEELCDSKVGTTKVEKQVSRISSERKGKEKVTRDEKLIVMIMKSKVHDAKKIHWEAVCEANSFLKTIKIKYGAYSRTATRTISSVNRTAQSLRYNIEAQHARKKRFLKQKYKPTYVVPEDIQDIRKLRIFNEDG